jgi:hypothetical protein
MSRGLALEGRDVDAWSAYTAGRGANPLPRVRAGASQQPKQGNCRKRRNKRCKNRRDALKHANPVTQGRDPTEVTKWADGIYWPNV